MEALLGAFDEVDTNSDGVIDRWEFEVITSIYSPPIALRLQNSLRPHRCAAETALGPPLPVAPLAKRH